MDTTLQRTPAGLSLSASKALGVWEGDANALASRPEALFQGLKAIDTPLFCVARNGALAVTSSGAARLGDSGSADGLPLVGYAPAVDPGALGDRTFCADHGLRYPYVAGAMANGIGSEAIVDAMARAGMLGFFGAAGLSVERVRAAIDRIQSSAGDLPYGFNLIHSPNESGLEDALVDLYIERGVSLVEASAFLQLTPALIRYRLHEIRRDAEGRVVTPNRIIAKVSREEVAEKFMSPPPAKLLEKLQASGRITAEQAELAAEIPVAQDITAEADSGGHTDHRPAIALLPTLCSLRDRMQAKFAYTQRLRVGLAGGISTPESAVAAFAMGAAYVLTGSVNQACVEAGTSEVVRRMLAETRQADVTRAPAADMFEMGVTLQVLKRGTMFAMRAGKLYDLYRAHDGLESLPAEELAKLENTVFRLPLDEVWRQTRAFFSERDPRQIERAERDAKHKMALVFRWYLGQSSNWANTGEAERVVDYQVWCGPAMGAFNEWAHGSPLEAIENRRVADVAQNILYGAAVLQRVNALRGQGLAVPAEATHVRPQTSEALAPYFAEQRGASNGPQLAEGNAT